jgi:hypothetical protein
MKNCGKHVEVYDPGRNTDRASTQGAGGRDEFG